MGCIMSKAGGKDDVKRDVDDLTLERVLIQKTRLDEMDDAYGRSSDFLNSMVKTNNDMVATMSNIRFLAAMLMGSWVVDINDKDEISLHTYVEKEEKGNFELVKTPVEKATADANVPLQEAIAQNGEQAARLKNAIAACQGKGLTVEVKDSGRRVVKGKVVNKKEKLSPEELELRDAVQDFNASLFSTKKLAVTGSVKEGLPTFAQALEKCKATMAECNPPVKPAAKVNRKILEDVAKGKRDADFGDLMQISCGTENPRRMKPKQRRVHEALMGKNSIPECLERASAELAEAPQDLSEVLEAVGALPMDPVAISTMCKDSRLPPAQMMKVPAIVAKNTAATKTAPTIMKTCQETMQLMVSEVQSVLS